MITSFGFLITSYLAILNFQTVVTLEVIAGSSVLLGTTEENQNLSAFCDDGKTKLKVDWDNSSTLEYTCSEPERYIPDPDIDPKEYYDSEVESFEAKHFCMDTKIKYKNMVLTYGDSRPVWAHYGEYKYIPPQRGFHNLEHGAIVMLYHPCANEEEIQKLKSLIKNCLRRYLITPYTGLCKKRPFVLVSWGRSLKMNSVDKEKVIKFIRDYAITHAPKNVATDGKYDYELLEKPKQEDIHDSDLCPNYN